MITHCSVRHYLRSPPSQRRDQPRPCERSDMVAIEHLHELKTFEFSKQTKSKLGLSGTSTQIKADACDPRGYHHRLKSVIKFMVM